MPPRFGTSPPPPPPPLTIGQFLKNLIRGRYDRMVGRYVKATTVLTLSALFGLFAAGAFNGKHNEPDPHSSHSAPHDPHGGHHDSGGHHDAHGGGHDAGGHDSHGSSGAHGAHDGNGHHDMNAELDKFLRHKKEELEKAAGGDGFHPFR